MSDETKVIQPFADIPPALPIDVPDLKRFINGKSLNIGTGDTCFKSDRQGIWLGANKFVDAPFKAAMNGDTRVNILTNKSILFEAITSPVAQDGQLWCALNSSNQKVLWGYFGGDTTHRQQISMSRMEKGTAFDYTADHTITISTWFQPRMILFNGFFENTADDKYGITNGHAGIVSPVSGFCNSILLDFYDLNNVVSDLTFGSMTALDCDGLTCNNVPIVTGYNNNSMFLVSQIKIGVIVDSIGASSVDKEVYLYVDSWGDESVTVKLVCPAGWRMAGDLTVFG